MKKIVIGILTAIIIVSGLTSCKKSDDNSSPSVSSTISSGTWRVSYYYDKTKDETSDFAGYTFTFQSGGQLTASSSAGSENGTWSEKNDDDNGGSHKLVITIGSSTPLIELTDDWVITSQSDSKIELKDDSNNNEILHLSKN